MNQRGQYGSGGGQLRNGRGEYGALARARSVVSGELSSEEIKDALEAGNRASEPLALERAKMMREWKEDVKLSSAQMSQIMDEALKVARETVKNLVTMIDKVPSRDEWLSALRMERNTLTKTIEEESRFRDLAAKVTAPTVVPGFRDWISRLLLAAENGVTVIGFLAHILPDWLRMRDIVSSIHQGAVAAINGIIAFAKGVGGGVADVAKGLGSGIAALPTVLKVAGGAALILGGVWAVSKLRSPSRSVTA